MRTNWIAMTESEKFEWGKRDALNGIKRNTHNNSYLSGWKAGQLEIGQ